MRKHQVCSLEHRERTSADRTSKLFWASDFTTQNHWSVRLNWSRDGEDEYGQGKRWGVGDRGILAWSRREGDSGCDGRESWYCLWFHCGWRRRPRSSVPAKLSDINWNLPLLNVSHFGNTGARVIMRNNWKCESFIGLYWIQDQLADIHQVKDWSVHTFVIFHTLQLSARLAKDGSRVEWCLLQHGDSASSNILRERRKKSINWILLNWVNWSTYFHQVETTLSYLHIVQFGVPVANGGSNIDCNWDKTGSTLSFHGLQQFRVELGADGCVHRRKDEFDSFPYFWRPDFFLLPFAEDATMYGGWTHQRNDEDCRDNWVHICFSCETNRVSDSTASSSFYTSELNDYCSTTWW